MRRRDRMKDNFDSSSWSLSDGQDSPDGKWHCNYKSGGTAACQTSSGGSRTGGKVMFLQPSYTSGQTKAVFVRNRTKFYDFELTFDMRTVSQNRTPTPNNWEVGWLIFRYTDDWHHYYMLIQRDGGLELGRKDYFPHVEQQQFLVTNANNAPTFVLGQWYNFKLRCVKNNIRVWIDGVSQCNITDDGSFGFDSATGGTPPAPSSALYGGYFGPYNEDAAVEYDNVVCRAL